MFEIQERGMWFVATMKNSLFHGTAYGTNPSTDLSNATLLKRFLVIRWPIRAPDAIFSFSSRMSGRFVLKYRSNTEPILQSTQLRLCLVADSSTLGHSWYTFTRTNKLAFGASPVLRSGPPHNPRTSCVPDTTLLTPVHWSVVDVYLACEPPPPLSLTAMACKT